MRMGIAMLCALVLIGCAGAPALPPEPTYRPLKVYEFEGGIYFDGENTEILLDNLRKMHEYQQVLQQTITGGR